MAAGTLEIHHLNKQYTLDGVPFGVLADINLHVDANEFICIVGASGCGKSTLLRLLVGLEAGYDGELLVDGKPITGPGLERGIIFQEHRLFPWLTVKDNVRLGLLNIPISEQQKDARVQDHIELVGLSDFANSFPAQLSGGMSQRVAIARALVTRPRFLLLDEPFGALDAMTRAHLQQELQQILQRERITAIMVTHDVEEAVTLADRIVVMQPNPGRIKRILDVPLPRPRVNSHSDFNRIKESVLSDFALSTLTAAR